MNPLELCRQAQSLGLRLEPAGDKLAVFPKGKCPPDFADMLRAHKPELLSWLEGRAAGLRSDKLPWLHVARQILAGEFEGADRSTVQSLAIGLRSIGHPLCQQALARLILAGEFDGCDRSMRESLTVGLRSIRHPDCRRALERLQRDKTPGA